MRFTRQQHPMRYSAWVSFFILAIPVISVSAQTE
ncbi:MAG: hypothetical protein RIR79_2048, partial [Pseudomonadota bacterium]